ncbi:hypothetical protein VIGAN_09143500 [Vigna angularis var. angularis]|uniref:Uncharacterized protein n=1 Tax=Vigna angularis var. angularis TaxID=157739 RepID=A0A0S3SY77_PHAAN|nr:hypothetical protein VIGAN_09143500 [Vigna angularis var. angularis]
MLHVSHVLIQKHFAVTNDTLDKLIVFSATYQCKKGEKCGHILWLWCDPKGRWMVGKRGKRCGRRTFVFHSVVYWNHILGGVHAMI